MNSSLSLISSSTCSLEPRPNEKEQEKSQAAANSHKTKLQKLFDCITVEPIMCCYIFPYTLALIAVYNLTFQMACRVNLSYNDTVCDNLLSTNHSQFEIQIQKEAAKMLVWKRPMSTLIPAILNIFIGSYSDRHKIRKPFFLLPVVGEIINSFLLILCTINISTWPMESSAIAETLMYTLTGGFCTLKMAIYSYVSDISPLETRTARLGIVQVLSSVMAPLAMFLSSIMFETTGFYGVFSTRGLLFLFAMWYGVFRVKETMQHDNLKTKNFCADFFDPRNAVDTFSVLFKKKNGKKRINIWLMLVAFIIVKGSSTAEGELLYMYTRLRFQWDDITYGFYSSFNIIVRLAGSTVAIAIFNHWLKIDDRLVAPLAFTSTIFGSCIYAFSPSSKFLYLGSVVGLMSDYQTVPIRSWATKAAGADELGKVQSLFGVMEALAPSVYVPLYSAVYSATVQTSPGIFYMATAITLTPLVPMFLCMYFLQERETEEPEETVKIKHESFRYVIPIHDLF